MRLAVPTKPEEEFVEKPLADSNIDKVAVVCLGPPVLSWSVQDLSDPAFLENGYTQLKPLLQAEYRNIRWRPQGYFETLQWNLGTPAKRVGVDVRVMHGFRAVLNGPPIRVQDVHDRLFELGEASVLPELQAAAVGWATLCIASSHYEDWEVVEGLLRVLEKRGPDADFMKRLVSWGRSEQSRHRREDALTASQAPGTPAPPPQTAPAASSADSHPASPPRS
jgi:hypothetical protein